MGHDIFNFLSIVIKAYKYNLIKFLKLFIELSNIKNNIKDQSFIFKSKVVNIIKVILSI